MNVFPVLLINQVGVGASACSKDSSNLQQPITDCQKGPLLLHQRTQHHSQAGHWKITQHMSTQNVKHVMDLQPQAACVKKSRS